MIFADSAVSRMDKWSPLPPADWTVFWSQGSVIHGTLWLDSIELWDFPEGMQMLFDAEDNRIIDEVR